METSYLYFGHPQGFDQSTALFSGIYRGGDQGGWVGEGRYPESRIFLSSETCQSAPLLFQSPRLHEVLDAQVKEYRGLYVPPPMT